MGILRNRTSESAVADNPGHCLHSNIRVSLNHGSEWARCLCVTGKHDDILVVATGDGRLLVFDTDTGTLRQEFQDHNETIRRMSRFRDNGVVAIGENAVLVFDAHECKSMKSINVLEHQLTSFKVIDNNVLVVGDANGNLKVFVVEDKGFNMRRIENMEWTHRSEPRDDTTFVSIVKRIKFLGDCDEKTKIHKPRICDIASFSNDLVSLSEDGRAVQWKMTKIGDGRNQVPSLHRGNEWNHKGPVTCVAMNESTIVICGLDEIRIRTRKVCNLPEPGIPILRGAKHEWMRRIMKPGKSFLSGMSVLLQDATTRVVRGAHSGTWIHKVLLLNGYFFTAGGDGRVCIFNVHNLSSTPLFQIDINDYESTSPNARAVGDMVTIGNCESIALCGHWYSDAFIVDLPSLNSSQA